MTEQAEAAPSALPRWYDPAVPLVACVDGPRAGAWYQQSWLDAGWLDGYTPTGANPVPHRLDSRITATPVAWTTPTPPPPPPPKRRRRRPRR